MLDDNKMEIVNVLLSQIQNDKEITLHQVNIFLSYALEGVTDKKDLCDEERLTIKCIREQLKGL